jgi:hypothetical protein
VVRKLQLLLPGVRIWLDVDNLSDLGRLEESVADAAVFVIFLSATYFRSANCRHEMYTALALNRPIVTVRETDEDKGGASVDALQRECQQFCVEAAPAAYPAYLGPEEALRRVFGREPIMWSRVNDFQTVSLKMIAVQIIQYLPYYVKNPGELRRGLCLRGELGPVSLTRPVTLLVSRANAMAQSLAEEISLAAGSPSITSPIVIMDAEDFLEQGEVRAFSSPPEQSTMLLLYLNEETFKSSDGRLADVVKRARDALIELVLVHEQKPSCGARPFGDLLKQTPELLKAPPYKIYDKVAVPLYPSAEHREVSLRRVLIAMGATRVRRLAYLRTPSFGKSPSSRSLSLPLSVIRRLNLAQSSKASRSPVRETEESATEEQAA